MTQSPMRVLLLHGVNVWNTGDLGLLHTTVRRLREEFGPAVDLATEDVFSGTGPSVESELRHLGITSSPPLVPLRKERGWSRLRWIGHVVTVFVAIVLVRASGMRVLASFPRSVRDPIRSLMDADLVISKPGGHLYSAPGRWIGSPSYLFTIWSASMLGRPTILYAQSVGPFASPLAVLAARVALREVRMVTAREPLTYRWARQMLPASVRVELTADEAFLLEPALAPAHGATRMLGITAIEWHYPGHPHPRTAAARYESALADVARWYIDECGGRVVLLRWLTGGHREDDAAVIDRIADLVDRPGQTSVVGPFRPDEASGFIGGLELLVASRLHSAIFGMVAGTPAVAIEYLPKTREIMAMVLGPGWTVPIGEVGAGRLLELVQRLRDQQGPIRADMARSVQQLAVTAASNARIARETAQE